MSNFITTHNEEGKAIFTTKVPEAHHDIPLPFAKLNIIYTTHAPPSNLGDESDLAQYAHDRSNGLPGGAFCPGNGTCASIMTFPPESETPMHRTVTLDYVFVVRGAIELQLDSGEKRTLTVGDSAVQRGTMHKFVNVTPDGGEAQIIAIAQAASKVEVAGKELGMEFVA